MALWSGGGTFPQPQEQSLQISDIVWNNEQHSIMIGNTTVMLTATEYRLLYPLRAGVAITYRNLALAAYNYTVDEKVRIMMDKHIDRIRSKLRGTGIYIYCVLSYGYLLLPELTEDDTPGNVVQMKKR